MQSQEKVSRAFIPALGAEAEKQAGFCTAPVADGRALQATEGVVMRTEKQKIS